MPLWNAGSRSHRVSSTGLADSRLAWLLAGLSVTGRDKVQAARKRLRRPAGLFARRRCLLAVALLLAAGAGFWGAAFRIPVTQRVAVNYVVTENKILLSEKVVHFLARHQAMRRLALEIAGDKATDVQRAQALQAWVARNILPQERAGDLPVVDDHPYSIVVRGYGTAEQRADLFTILCGYAGIRAAMYRLQRTGSGKAIHLAVVRLADGPYLLFDPARDNLFYGEGGRLATLAELNDNPAVAKRAKNQPVIDGVPYAEYFSGIHPVSGFRRFTRADLQRPLPRILYETGRLLGLFEEALLYY